jgi:hypothetical protein
MERVGDREGKMERYCLTGQSPQLAVAPKEEEEADLSMGITCEGTGLSENKINLTTMLKKSMYSLMFHWQSKETEYKLSLCGTQ